MLLTISCKQKIVLARQTFEGLNADITVKRAYKHMKEG